MADLIEHLPIYYRESKIGKDITTPMNIENNIMADLIKEYTNQFVVSSATFALKRYEEEYGLPISPEEISIEERRSRVKARMRMVGAVNKEMLQNVINAWTNAQVEIIEDYANYNIIIKFVSIIGIPSNIQDVYNAINEIIPAHLNVEYKFKYNKWSDVEGKTWGELEQYTWQEVLEKGVI